MSLVVLQDCRGLLGEHFHLTIDKLNISALQHTVILGPNGSGKSALAAYIAGAGEHINGLRHVTEQLAWVSVEQQQALIEAEKQKDCADILDIIPVPTTVREILFADLPEQDLDQDLLQRLLRIFSLSPLLDKPFQGLSTGETRKLLLSRAILSQPQLLILDEPWDGLDQHSCQELNLLLEALAKQFTLLLVVNRLSEVPTYCRQLVLLQTGAIQWQSPVTNNLADLLSHIAQLQHMQQQELVLPLKDDDRFAPHPLDKNAPLVKLTQAKVSYGEQVVFSGLDWTIMPNQHWQVSGPNGSGKTCLLNLINGDHPQCYVNDIQVFGFQRGSGESIWQIKQYIGYMSNGLHLDYRVNCSVLHVILSGFYDSIGLYQNPTNKQKQLAQQWLALMALDKQHNTPFQQLSFGDQRLVLIARAMVKHPALLVLDEPCNGLDDINRLKVLALIELLAREGNTTLLYVNHHQEDVIPSITQYLSMTDYRV
ncbi:molybdate ABC transporter ATP-binding protein ModF [Paraglaciecola hydrolytica]|uniref:Molybdenum ABC transporter ATP-binding protein n=1 Tax=Paraglaciecola hydrolytica TaxID=1799789 RepID=A0A136A4N3_9ALTE|nr:molybdate ABC transporter ATP-binding protein ModF [Paraglaciecola hydrolytica]KXI30181.1 molybdenum ABC transporter ATP-binding protein [Paraglaciecola hydrolytica]